MTGYLVRRAGQMVLTLFLIITFAFFLVQAQPGDYATFYALNPDMPPEVKEQLRAAFGVDKPLWQQYLFHLKNTVTGNFGVSFGHFPRPVMDVLIERVPRTAVLFLTATVMSFYIGFLLGKAIAWRRGGVLEYTATISGATLFTVFTPAFALMMIWIFAFRLGWLPVGKFLDPLVWRHADVSANFVFGQMLLTAFLITVFAFLTFYLLRKTGRIGLVKWAGPIIAAGLAVALLVWFFSGIGGLALDILRHMILPIATLTLISFAGTMLLTRNSMLETVREDYVMAARAKGCPKSWSATATPPATPCSPWLPAWFTASSSPSTAASSSRVSFPGPAPASPCSRPSAPKTCPWSWGRWSSLASSPCWPTS